MRHFYIISDDSVIYFFFLPPPQKLGWPQIRSGPRHCGWYDPGYLPVRDRPVVLHRPAAASSAGAVGARAELPPGSPGGYGHVGHIIRLLSAQKGGAVLWRQQAERLGPGRRKYLKSNSSGHLKCKSTWFLGFGRVCLHNWVLKHHGGRTEIFWYNFKRSYACVCLYLSWSLVLFTRQYVNFWSDAFLWNVCFMFYEQISKYSLSYKTKYCVGFLLLKYYTCIRFLNLKWISHVQLIIHQSVIST